MKDIDIEISDKVSTIDTDLPVEKFMKTLAAIDWKLWEILKILQKFDDEEAEEEEESDDSNRILSLKNIEGAISFKDVCFSYEDEKEVLHSISFEAKAGETIARVGSTGSGKSTIAGLVATLIKPDKGTNTIDGNPLTSVTLDSYRKHLGVVLQDEFLFEGTIKENILYARPDADETQLKEAVIAAYVNEFTDRFEDGLNTLIGERGVKLSGGQRQRISIARAMLKNSSIILLDEATSALDSESEAKVKHAIDNLIKNRTTIVIAHRLSTIKNADKIIVLMLLLEGLLDSLLHTRVDFLIDEILDLVSIYIRFLCFSFFSNAIDSALVPMMVDTLNEHTTPLPRK